MQRALEKVSRAACEVMARYELGQFSPRVRARLADIFRKDPPDALERIETAAAHLGVTGEHADTLLDEPMHTWPASLPTPTPTHRLEESPTDRLAGTLRKATCGKQARP